MHSAILNRWAINLIYDSKYRFSEIKFHKADGEIIRLVSLIDNVADI